MITKKLYKNVIGYNAFMLGDIEIYLQTGMLKFENKVVGISSNIDSIMYFFTPNEFQDQLPKHLVKAKEFALKHYLSENLEIT